MIKYTQKQIEELDKFYKHPRKLVDLFEDTAAKWVDRNAIGTKNLQTRQYEWITYKRLAERINNARGGLNPWRITKGDAVGVNIGNSVESLWVHSPQLAAAPSFPRRRESSVLSGHPPARVGQSWY